MRQGASALIAVAAAAVVASGCATAASPIFPQHDPNLRGTFFGDFFWALPDGPDQNLPADLEPAALRDAVEQIDDAVGQADWETFPARVVALFPTTADAASHAAALRDVIRESAEWFAEPANADAYAAIADADRLAPLTPPEATAVVASGNAPGDRGIGWGGEPKDAAVAVTSVGPFLVLTGVEAEAAQDVPPPHPLVGMLGGYGATVLLEGDRFGEGTIVADVSCRPPDEATGARLRDEIGDTFVVVEYHATPPWVAPPSAEQALARATVHRWRAASVEAMRDAIYRGYVERLIANIDDPVAYQATVDEMTVYLEERMPDLVDGPVDAATLGLVADRPDDSASPEYRDWLRALGARVGQLPLEPYPGGSLFPLWRDYATEAHTAGVRMEAGRLEIAWSTFGRFSTGGLQLLAYLLEAGCTDMRIGLVDFDAVRGD